MNTLTCARCGRRGERGYQLGEVGGEYAYRCTNREACQRRVDAPVVENTQYAEFMGRCLRSMGRRAAGDVDFLAALVQHEADVQDALTEAIAGCRHAGYSWAEIGARLGITRQSAQERFARRLHAV